jgi:hypothetical protein
MEAILDEDCRGHAWPFSSSTSRGHQGAAQRSAEQCAITLGFLICGLSVGGNTDPAGGVHAKTCEPSWGLFEFSFYPDFRRSLGSRSMTIDCW